MIIETFLFNALVGTKKNEKNIKDNVHWLQLSALAVLKVIITLIAMNLSWNCNSKTNIFINKHCFT